VDDPDHPDIAIIDLDPQTGATWDDVKEAAHIVHELLDAIDLQGFPKTTGSRGIHIWVPIARNYTFEESRNFVLELRDIVAARTLTSRAERDRAYRDVVRRQPYPERAKDRLRCGATVSRSQDSSASQRVFARVFGSFWARSCAGASRSPTAARRADMFAIVKASGRPSAPACIACTVPLSVATIGVCTGANGNTVSGSSATRG